MNSQWVIIVHFRQAIPTKHLSNSTQGENEDAGKSGTSSAITRLFSG